MFLEELFVQIGVVIALASLLAFVFHRLRQPLVVAYLVTGILVGPGLLHLVTSTDFFHTLSDIGVAFLLFVVGLNLDWKHLKEVGMVALSVGIGQVVFTSAVGYGLAQLFGFTPLVSLFIGVAFTFSSTIIIIKLLSDKEELDSLYGRISVGFLIVQDLIAMLLLLILSAAGSGQSLQMILTVAAVKWLVVVAGAAVLSTWILPRVATYAARSQELLFLFGIAWCFALASALSLAGFGVEIGALIAGISLAGSGWSQQLTARVRPLRDFFLIIFFVVLGSQLTLGNVGALVQPVIVFSLFILIGNPLIVMLILRLLGYHPRTGFMAGTTVAQVSEFSFILIAAGMKLGVLTSSVMTLATLVGLVTITVSSYLITFNEQVYDFLAPLFRPLEPHQFDRQLRRQKKERPEVVMIGYHRMGEVILPQVKALKRPYLVIDFDPLVIERLKAQHLPALYGDGGDMDFLSDIKLERAALVISTVPEEETSLRLVHYLKQKAFAGSVIVTVKTPEEAGRLYRAGAAFVIVPSMLSGERFSELLQKGKMDVLAWKRSSTVDKKKKTR